MYIDALNDLNIFIFAKARDGKFLFCNEKFAETSGLDSPFSLIGKTDRDMVWREQADFFQSTDRLAIQGHTQTNAQEVIIQHNKVADILVCKCSLMNKSNESIGVIGSYVDITGLQLLRKTGYFDKKSNKFHLGPDFHHETLSAQQFRVFQKVLLGNTAAQIAQQLDLSERTVEHYIAEIKQKLQCNTKGEIIAAAVKSGLTHVLQNKINVDH